MQKLELKGRLDQAHGVFDINCVSWNPLENHHDILASCADDDQIKLWKIQ